ncbi:phosphoribosylglycinamide formyltransferase [Undibacterium sp. RTI2.1]|uniref:phosphoribosylglycinamide formyltransferase n=1 Tax=unclassified Undibacterium TaxID=2630295 RepID=UPI002AB5D486|nr:MULTISPECIES: phosphoribosylglycinamide formyltransferase [unclassified Undibacterium]MDY7538524.1 phosphoribosylglycinamide formyltransferase [Undibacterium sp. 5I1]MEB0031932.1 phosphoribosylglycinamide formyltransferase [Undibacterium sp. RTI2.1]MEB0116396.1 phosphoribosylglycinamide formyltransferase [Undibacterium sp. RTI2.2]MEB0231878.1 phosphoribosylglycinamide formyltransferase [Undibacterium sp. 10I3]MEB0258945.1 phosphoribosylglycinamide formyltransferase [Undibacterium sp. 5I1]
MKKIVILISGQGSNMQAIVQAAKVEQWQAEIVAVISNRPDAPGLDYAAKMDIPTVVVESKSFTSREAFDAVLQQQIDQFAPDLVVLAGFMRILTSAFVQHYADRMINVHPSLLPSFVGLATHQQALNAGVKLHGITVHFVTPELDHGPIIAQAAVPVLNDDTVDSLSRRVLEQEHVIYPRAVRWFIEGKLKMIGNRVHVIGE